MNGPSLGIDPDEFVARFPQAWHMAEAGSWDSIVKHGLMSTSALLDLFEVTEDRRFEIESTRRRESITLRHPKHGTAVVRDQKPLIEKVLDKTLEGATTSEFCRLLNSQVFFWLNTDRLERMRNAPPYAKRPHLILRFRTSDLVERHRDRVRLSPMNSGATHPGANYPRGPATFQPFDTYPWRARSAVNRKEPVVEMTIGYAVPDAAELVVHRETR